MAHVVTTVRLDPLADYYAPPLYTLPNGITFNTRTGLFEGTVYDTTYSLPTGDKITVADGENLQTAINNASRGDVIVLASGSTWTGNYNFPEKAGTDWIYIMSSDVYDGIFPRAEGERVTPADASDMACIETANTTEALAFTDGPDTSYVRLVGLEIRVAAGNGTMYNLVRFGDPAESTEGNLPTDLIADRCYVHGTDTGDLTRGFQMSCVNWAVINSYVDDCHNASSDSQAINAVNSPGPGKIRNNRLRAAGENFMSGGSDPAVTGLNPSDIEFRKNYCDKDFDWVAAFSVKNLFELKVGLRVLVQGNVFENNWADGQDGYAWVLKTANQSGGHTAANMQDVTMWENEMANVAQVCEIIGNQGTVLEPTNRTEIKHLVAYSITGISPQSKVFRLMASESEPVADITLHNITADDPGSHIIYWPTATAIYNNLAFNNNVIGDVTANGIYGVGSSPAEGDVAWDDHTTGSSEALSNVLTGESYGGNLSSNSYPANTAAVGFVNYAGDDLRLDSGSAYKGTGTDDNDPGANIDAINTAVSGVK